MLIIIAVKATYIILLNKAHHLIIFTEDDLVLMQEMLRACP